MNECVLSYYVGAFEPDKTLEKHEFSITQIIQKHFQHFIKTL